jgi:hypothetical protein
MGGKFRLPYIILLAFLLEMPEMCVRCPINATTSRSTSLGLAGDRRIFGPVYIRMARHSYNMLPVEHCAYCATPGSVYAYLDSPT